MMSQRESYIYEVDETDEDGVTSGMMAVLDGCWMELSGWQVEILATWVMKNPGTAEHLCNTKKWFGVMRELCNAGF